MTSPRPSVRVVCVDPEGEVLMLHWQDPVSARRLWEPPGGGIEAGETPAEAAVRELAEETGIEAEVAADESLTVWREVTWNGKTWAGDEEFFLVRLGTRPEVSREGLLPYERATCLGHRWVAVDDLATLPDALEPPELASIVLRLVSSPG